MIEPHFDEAFADRQGDQALRGLAGDSELAGDLVLRIARDIVEPAGAGRFIEVQGTAEGMAFSRDELDSFLGLAEHGITQIFELQRELVAEPPPPRAR